MFSRSDRGLPRFNFPIFYFRRCFRFVFQKMKLLSKVEPRVGLEFSLSHPNFDWRLTTIFERFDFNCWPCVSEQKQLTRGQWFWTQPKGMVPQHLMFAGTGQTALPVFEHIKNIFMQVLRRSVDLSQKRHPCGVGLTSAQCGFRPGRRCTDHVFVIRHFE
jgi:hypothetical protein